MKKNHLPSWSPEMHGWSVKMRSLFRVVKPGIFISVRGLWGSYGPRPKAAGARRTGCPTRRRAGTEAGGLNMYEEVTGMEVCGNHVFQQQGVVSIQRDKGITPLLGFGG
jgi:hypothetical protein